MMSWPCVLSSAALVETTIVAEGLTRAKVSDKNTMNIS
jgi:hypothetical protein